MFMRKRLISPAPERVQPHDEGSIDLDSAAVVEITSERRIIRSSLRCSREKRGAGVQLDRELKLSG